MPVISLSRIIAFWADQQPDRVAIDHEGAQVTWAQLEARTNRLARAYETLGVGQDDFVTIALPNGIEFLEACFAAWKLGATPQPISAKLPKLERDQIVDLAKPALVVGCAPNEYAATAVRPRKLHARRQPPRRRLTRTHGNLSEGDDLRRLDRPPQAHRFQGPRRC